MNIEIKDLSQVYKNDFRALNRVNLEINPGMFGLLGPNGAGKSTLMRILVTLQKPTHGEVFVNGMPLSKNRKEVRSYLGYLPQDFRFFAKLRTWEFLDYAASLAGIKSKKQRLSAVDDLLEQVGLFDVRNRFANKLSGGMKRRLGIAQALIGDPKIIIVDEPTTGLDPEERIRFRNILSNLSQKEVIIILSTHIVGDISSTCSQMALLNSGEVHFTGSPEQFIKQSEGHVFKTSVTFDEMKRISETFPVITSIPDPAGYEVEFVADKPNGWKASEVQPNLEHAYVYFMEYLTKSKIELE
ncbi:ABC transporter ATP-binding protein [Carboxylicivirga linearis]|uniref:ABC transporter ATP-binding protein n=1 Tax=Carboxylicivirga linearis TaxID=1628157 RepID=A0ABS5JYU1_9BACT|nr:ABC transporter ATP-binding protein [Carboxylicivirga linearis]MBS2100072.1 ABC transporter ATP-binding protein [Carboxylicivirga linearis]